MAPSQVHPGSGERHGSVAVTTPLENVPPAVDDDWVTVDGEFVFVAAINLPELAQVYQKGG